MAIKPILPSQTKETIKLDWWLERRKDIIKRFMDHLGMPPQPRNTRSIEVMAKTDCEEYTKLTLRYIVGDQDEIRAFLLVPNTESSAFPAIVAMHQTNDIGKDEVIGSGGNRDYAYGYELARRGYVVLAPDYLTAGERIFAGRESFDSMPFYERYPGWSMVGKDLEDSKSAVDVLSSFDFVDKSRIGVIGHSHGGSNAIFAMALDERVSVCVSNCGMSVISEEEKRLEWSTEDGYIYFPTLRKYLLEGKDLPFDINEVAALIAPRPWCNISAFYDKTLGNQEFLAEAGVQINQVYKLYNKQLHFCYLMHGNDHSFPNFARKLAYEWLDRFLKR